MSTFQPAEWIAGIDQARAIPMWAALVSPAGRKEPVRKVETNVIENSKPASSSLDPGLATLVMLLRFQGIGVDPSQISHQFGAAPIDVREMLRSAKGLMAPTTI